MVSTPKVGPYCCPVSDHNGQVHLKLKKVDSRIAFSYLSNQGGMVFSLCCSFHETILQKSDYRNIRDVDGSQIHIRYYNAPCT